jgi:hypothetical protein
VECAKYIHDGATLHCKGMKTNGILTLKIKQGERTFSTLKQLSDMLRLKPNSSKFKKDLAAYIFAQPNEPDGH